MDGFPTYKQFYQKNQLFDASPEQLALAKQAYRKAYQKFYRDKGKKAKKDIRLELRLDPKLVGELEKEAKALNLSRPNYLKKLVIQARTMQFQLVDEKILRALIIQLRKIGTNINQQTKLAHRLQIDGLRVNRLKELSKMVELAVDAVNEALKNPPLKDD